MLLEETIGRLNSPRACIDKWIEKFKCKILSIGLAGTEEMYWAVNEFETCLGIEITASHNPINFNGLKIVKSGAKPLDYYQDLLVIKSWQKRNNLKKMME